MTNVPVVDQDPARALARLVAIVESSDDAIVSKTLDGVVTSWNAGAERIFGYTAAEMIGKPISLLFPEDRLNEEPLILQRIHNGERVDHFETVRRSKDGRELYVSVTISPIRDGTGKIVGASKIARDITGQKKAERELREARDVAEAASRAKDYFLSVLSHELRTPLTPTLAAISMFEAGVSMTPDELKGHYAMIRRNVETQARLVDDLLDVTRISRGKMTLHPEAVDAHAAIRAVVAMLQGQIDEKRLMIALALRSKTSYVWADPGRFQQVLLNLLSNAVKFTPPEGSITLTSSDDPATACSFKLEITDTGVGIAPEILPRLFRSFEQGEQTITRRFGGLGLGLAIVSALTELHGGSVSAQSEGVDRGATFTLNWEAVPTGPVTPTPSPAANAALEKKLRVLLVEDHDDTRNALTRLLRGFGCEVTAAASVHEAKRHADATEFDLLLSDIGLPDGSGLDVMRYIKARHKTRGIALSGFGQDEDLRRSTEAGFERHMTKPLNLQVLRNAIFDKTRSD